MLKTDRFERVGHGGIGNPRSKNAQSMAFFKEQLYLGVTHHSGEGPMDAARILRLDPATAEWEVVYQSPLVTADERASASHVYQIGRTRSQETHEHVPLFRGFRGMVVFQGKGDPEPALYVGTVSHWGAQILRSVDGENFIPVIEPGLGNPDLLSFRQLVPFRDRLFAAPAGSISGEVMDRNFGESSTVFVADDPAGGSWREAMPTSLGDMNNKAIFGMTVFNDQLHVGTGNPRSGFQVWRTQAEGEPPYQWQCVLRNGAWRHNLNEVAIALVPFKDALYIGTGIPGLGYDKSHDVGPGAAELIRLNADDSWDLIVGSPRFTPDGLQVPLAAMGPGFDDPMNTVFWSIGTHNGSIYVGTNNVRPWRVALNAKPEMAGGSQLWGSDDGENWEPVTLDGFGNPYAIGIRTQLSTPHGFFVGTSNHAEIEGLWQRRTGKKGTQRLGGLEIWRAG